MLQLSCSRSSYLNSLRRFLTLSLSLYFVSFSISFSPLLFLAEKSTFSTLSTLSLFIYSEANHRSNGFLLILLLLLLLLTKASSRGSLALSLLPFNLKEPARLPVTESLCRQLRQLDMVFLLCLLWAAAMAGAGSSAAAAAAFIVLVNVKFLSRERPHRRPVCLWGEKDGRACVY